MKRSWLPLTLVLIHGVLVALVGIDVASTPTPCCPLRLGSVHYPDWPARRVLARTLSTGH
jgi:hypothetical protein